MKVSFLVPHADIPARHSWKEQLKQPTTIPTAAILVAWSICNTVMEAKNIRRHHKELINKKKQKIIWIGSLRSTINTSKNNKERACMGHSPL